MDDFDKQSRDFNKANLTPHVGKWVAVLDGNVIASSDSLDITADIAKKKSPRRRPIFCKVPTKRIHV